MIAEQWRWRRQRAGGKQTICQADWQPVDICAACKIQFTAVPACTGAVTPAQAPHDRPEQNRKCDSGQTFHLRGDDNKSQQFSKLSKQIKTFLLTEAKVLQLWL